jgi:hypothetical protein
MRKRNISVVGIAVDFILIPILSNMIHKATSGLVSSVANKIKYGGKSANCYKYRSYRSRY